MATSISEVLAAKQLKSGLDLSPSRGSMQAHALPQKSPHRYQQSSESCNKFATSCPAESYGHHHHQRHHHEHRRRGNSEGDKVEVAPEERVHLLSELPWRTSAVFSDGNSNIADEASTPSLPRINIPAVSPTLPRRYDNAPNFQQRQRTFSMPTGKRPNFGRRGKQRARSQDVSSPSSKRGFLELPLKLQLQPQTQQYKGSLLIGVQRVISPESISDPETPETPLADSNGFISDPSIHSLSSQNNDMLQRFLGLQTDINQNYKGLTEEEINECRPIGRRGSSSSESSTSTLT